MSSSTELQLLALARKFHLPDPNEAFGRCFAATLGLAALAERSGIPVKLVRWQVVKDQDFCDHWVVLIEGQAVIDLTRVQVDGHTDLLHGLDSYPPNYLHPKIYPATLLLPKFERLTSTALSRLPFRFMWESGVALARYDICSAYHARLWRKLVVCVIEAIKFGWRSTRIALHAQLTLDPKTRRGAHN